MMKQLITFSFLAILFLTSCKKDRISADGNITTETRSLAAFTKVNTSGANKIRISYGADYKVEIRGSANLIPYYKTNIVNGNLYLSYENVNVNKDDLEIFVTLPLINTVSLSGSSKIDIMGDFPNVNFLKLFISGSGDITVKNKLTVNELSVNISGSGNVDGEKITCTDADVTISGSGDARFEAQRLLKAVISGSGKVYYFGNPTVDSRISGSGGVVKL